jgi:phosphomannomutase
VTTGEPARAGSVSPTATRSVPSVRDRARQWLVADPDPDTRAELQALLDADDDAALEERFMGTLEFGTAGLRGALGAGPTRMNRVVVRRATAGVAARLARDRDPASTIVVIGRDARHKSAAFAGDAVAVLAAHGFDVRQWAEPVPTPLLAYAARLLGAGAGIQITASHNPAADNGYKIYWEGGGQISPTRSRPRSPPSTPRSICPRRPTPGCCLTISSTPTGQP